jgi:hypothetical protein
MLLVFDKNVNDILGLRVATLSFLKILDLFSSVYKTGGSCSVLHQNFCCSSLLLMDFIWRNCIAVPDRCKRFLFSQKLSDLLWGHPACCSVGAGGNYTPP